MRSREVLMCSDRYAADIPFRLPNTQLPPTRSDFSKQSNSMPASCSSLTAAMPDEPAPITQADGSAGAVERLKRDTRVNFYSTVTVFAMPDPTRTAVGTWSGGRFMHFGEALDDERLIRLLRPDDGIRTVMTADTYGQGEADRLLGSALDGIAREDYCLVGAIGHDFYEGERDGAKGFPRFTDARLRQPGQYGS